MPVLPLIRHLSGWMTPFLARLPVTANQVTTASLMVGLGSAWALMQGDRTWAIVGGALLVMAYVLDNCDGEIARLKGQSSRFGMRFDSFVDWPVHAALFAALGVGAYHATGQVLWPWLGGVAAAGASVNYLVGFLLEARRPAAGRSGDGGPVGGGPFDAAGRPGDWRKRLVFVFRELCRADFCFIVLALAVADLTWVLLPLGAIGAQAYWATQLVRGADTCHV